MNIILLTAAMLVLSVISEQLVAEVAVSFSESSAEAWPGAGRNYGWQFTVNEPIVVTHLGLYDDGYNWDDGVWGDGFEIEHPIGLWRLSDSALLTSGTMSVGTIDPLLDDFRYINIPDVALDIGVDYVVGFYSASDLADKNIRKADDLQVDPAIELVVGRWGDAVWQFQMPTNIYEWDPMHDPYHPDFFGPNFQFIPEPATISLLALGGLFLRRRHRR